MQGSQHLTLNFEEKKKELISIFGDIFFTFYLFRIGNVLPVYIIRLHYYCCLPRSLWIVFALPRIERYRHVTVFSALPGNSSALLWPLRSSQVTSLCGTLTNIFLPLIAWRQNCLPLWRLEILTSSKS